MTDKLLALCCKGVFLLHLPEITHKRTKYPTLNYQRVFVTAEEDNEAPLL